MFLWKRADYSCGTLKFPDIGRWNTDLNRMGKLKCGWAMTRGPHASLTHFTAGHRKESMYSGQEHGTKVSCRWNQLLCLFDLYWQEIKTFPKVHSSSLSLRLIMRGFELGNKSNLRKLNCNDCAIFCAQTTYDYYLIKNLVRHCRHWGLWQKGLLLAKPLLCMFILAFELVGAHEKLVMYSYDTIQDWSMVTLCRQLLILNPSFNSISAFNGNYHPIVTMTDCLVCSRTLNKAP